MAKVNAPLLAFNAGEVSRAALARVDVEKLRLAAECQVNWWPSVIGKMMLRPGSKYLFSTRSDAAIKGVPFIFGASDTALLEFCDSHLRVIVADALVTRASVSSAVTNGDFSSAVGWTLVVNDVNSTASIAGGVLTLAAGARGATASATRSTTVAGGDQNVAHALRIVVTRGPVTFMCGSTSGASDYIARLKLDTGTHSLVFTPTTAAFHVWFESTSRKSCEVDSCTIEASGTLDLPSPYLAADLGKIRYAQSGDIVFIACDGYQPRRVERRDNNSWSIVLYQPDDGPFSIVDTNAVTFTPSVYGTNGTLTANKEYFNSGMVGKLFRLFTPGQVYKVILAAAATSTDAIRVAGKSVTDRGFSYVISGTWVGTFTLERSVEGSDTGFKAVETQTGNGTYAVDDSATYNDVVVWYRVTWTAKTSGSADVSFSAFTSPYGEESGATNFSAGSAANAGTAGICRVTLYTSKTVVNIEVLKPFSSINAASDWQPGDWSSYDGWPTEVKFFEGRLWWFRGDRRWAAIPDQPFSFDVEVEGESGTINRSFGDGPVDKINFALPLTRLVIGRETSIDPVRSTSFEEPLTPVNNKTKSCSDQGAAALPALKAGNRGIFVEKSGRRVFELVYAAEAQDYVARDITRLNDDIGAPGFVDLASQQQPDRLHHLIRADGEDAVCLDEPNDQVQAWVRSMTLGVIENVVVLPGTLEDAVYFVIKRTINGSTKRFWEKLALRSQCVGGTLNHQADAYLSVSQASSTTITGLSHLEGESVVVWANGKDLGSYTVASGSITASEAVTTAIVGLGGVTASYDDPTPAAGVSVGTKYNGYPAEVFASRSTGGKLRYVGTVTIASGLVTLPNSRTATRIIAYLGYYAPFMSAKLAYGARFGTALNQKKQLNALGLIAENMHPEGLSVGQTFEQMDILPLVEDGTDVNLDEIWDAYDMDVTAIGGEWDTDARLCLLAQAPRPVTLSGVVVAVQTNERG